MSAELPNFKKFISEEDIATAKQKRQEEWEKVRQPDQPAEAPEEEYDSRCLFEKLEANRLKKQEQFDEAHRLKNMVKGLENDEIEFLEQVSQKKEQEEQDKYLEERILLAEYKSSRVHYRTIEQEQEMLSVAKKPPIKQSFQQKPVNSQKLLLAGVIRKKSTSESQEPPPAKKSKYIVDDTSPTDIPAVQLQHPAKLETETKSNTIGSLPGIGDYSDSGSDSSEVN